MKRDYGQCIQENKIRPIERTDDRSSEMVSLVKHKLAFWKKVMKVAEDYPTVLIESHYELIKELLTALMNKEGLKSETHDCLFYYVQEKHPDLELDFEFLHDLRRTRNEVNYRGTRVPQGAWKDLKLKIDLTISYMIKHLEEMN